MLEQIVARLTADFEGFCTADVPAPEKLMMIFDNLFGNEKRARRYYTVVIDYMAQAIRERQVREYTQLIYASYRTYMERIVEDGMATGEFRRVDAPRVVSMILGMMEGLVLQWFFDTKGFDLDAAYEMCVDFMNTYLTPEDASLGERSPLTLEGRISNERCQAGTDPFQEIRAERFVGRLTRLGGMGCRNTAEQPPLDHPSVAPKEFLHVGMPRTELHPLRDSGDHRELAGQGRLEIALSAHAGLATAVGTQSRGDTAAHIVVVALRDEPTEHEKHVILVHQGPPSRLSSAGGQGLARWFGQARREGRPS